MRERNGWRATDLVAPDGIAPDGGAIATARLLLRPLRMSDAGMIGLYAADPRVARMTTSIPHPYPPGAAEGFVTATLSGRRGEEVLALDATPSGGAEFVGLLSVRIREGGEAELGYWVGPPFWNTGYATEALAAIVPRLLARGVPRIVASVFADNPVSAHVLERVGFRETGGGEAHSVARNGMVALRRFGYAP